LIRKKYLGTSIQYLQILWFTFGFAKIGVKKTFCQKDLNIFFRNCLIINELQYI
jgi:hypothetical protein